MKVVLDTNCFIDAVRRDSHAYDALQHIFEAKRSGRIQIMVSRHTLTELKQKEALKLVETCARLPYYPLGRWCDIPDGVTWKDLEGTWANGKASQEFQEEIEGLAKAGTSLRNRGAYVDALWARADVFVTSDKQLAAREPAKRISRKYGLRILTPVEFARELDAGKPPSRPSP